MRGLFPGRALQKSPNVKEPLLDNWEKSVYNDGEVMHDERYRKKY